MSSRGGSLLPSVYAYTRSVDCIIVTCFKGLTIEACDNSTECLASFEAQAAVSHKPLLSVMWLKGSDPAECANAKLMRAALPYLLEGTDFYDGTHVVCKD